MGAIRMLENPQDESVVRWGDGGDSFVVLEVGIFNYEEHAAGLTSTRRTRNSPSIYYQSTSSTATLQVSCGN
jgi:uncharacterized protein YigE (DUF2233 family)